MPKKRFIQDRDSSKGPNEEAETQHKALTQRKNLAFRDDTCLEKSSFEDDPKESWRGNEAEGDLDKRRWGSRLAWWGSTEKVSHLIGLKGRHQSPDQRSQLNQSSFCHPK